MTKSKLTQALNLLGKAPISSLPGNDSIDDRFDYFIGQRVLVGNEIGKVTAIDTSFPKGGIWVMRDSKGYASCYDPINVKPLPNGQL